MKMRRAKMIPVLLPVLLAGCHAPKQPDAAAAPPAPAATQEVATPAPAGSLQTMLVLTRHHWRLGDARTAGGQRIDALFAQQDKPLQLDFNASLMSVGNACNLMNARHTLNGDSLSLAPFASTMRACPEPALAALDREVGKRLHGEMKLRIIEGEPAQLVLTNAEGDVLSFVGVLTSAARYGGPGERVFLEVAAQTKPCSHPLIPDMQCLQVREIQYDDKGLKTGAPGAFENFYGQIEGFAHEAGVRNVLRVNRFRVKNPPADGSSLAYVLDMVVESDASGK